MFGVSFDGTSINTWGLYLSSFGIEKPAPKTSYIDIPFADGSADLSMASGEIKFAMRKVGMSLQKIMTRAETEALATTISNELNGKKVRITFDQDPNYYYYGRINNVSYKQNLTIGEIVVDAICEPYKYKHALTTREEVITTSKTVVITNDRKRAFPKITTTAAFSIVKDGVTYSYGTVSAMQTIIPLLEGSNTLEITGTGTITFEWQEGAL